MQCSTVTTVTEKETIHSGHFMVSHFDSEAQDEDEIAVSIPDGDTSKLESDEQVSIADEDFPVPNKLKTSQQLSIETSLTKLFQCMSLAYRQKLTSPKWNRFKGIRLRWKDKIRLNNLIWRCWHMQFIMKQNTLVCQFASPLDVDTHNKPEAVVLEGKYWKRRLNAVTAEYKKWRLFHRNRLIGCSAARDALGDVDLPDWPNQGSDYDIDSSHMLVDEDYMEFMTDTLFSTISANQPYPFPDSREIARAGLADFIQPSLGPLQPNLEDFMDTLEPLQEYRYKLPPVPEEPNTEEMYRPIEEGYSELDLLPSASNNNIEESAMNDLPDLIDQTQNISNQSQITFTNDKQFDQNFCDMNSSLQIFESNASIGSSNTNNQQNNQNQNIRSQPLFDRVQDISRYQTFEVISPNRTTILNSLESNTFKMPSPPPSNQRQAYKFPTSIGKNISFTNQAGQSSDFKMPTAPTNSQCWSPPSASQHQTFLPVASTQETNIMQLPNTLTKENSQQQNDAFLLASAKYASPTQKGRARSSSLGPRQGPPPLKASSSDPALVSSTNSVLLAQLLSNSSQSVFNLNSRTQNDKLNRIKAGSSSDLVSILPMQNTNAVTTTLLITSPIMMTSQQSTSQNQVVGTSFGSTTSLTSGSPKSMSIESPVSPLSPIGSPGMRAGSGGIHKDQRRAGHIHAEQKRRYNIKNGFDMLHSLIPQLNQNPNAKLSKAAMLQKGAQYIRQLQSERNQLKEEIDSLRQQIDCLNTSISNCQSLLPATGAPISRQRTNKMREMFDDYVRVRTLMNWKFWIFSLFFEPLLTSYTNCVSTSSMDELYSSTLLWIEQHCSLVDLRPVVLNSLKYLCTKTEILNEPSRLSEEARQAVSELQHKTQQ